MQALDDPDASEKPRLLDDPEVQEILLGGNQAGIENPLFLAATPSGSRLVGKTALGDEFILWDWAKRAEIKRWRVPKFDAPREEIVAQLKNDISPLIEGALASGNMTVGLEFISETELLEIKADGSIVRHDVEKGETLATIPAPRPVLADERIAAISHSLSNDRRRLALGFGDGAIAIVDLESAKPVFYSAEFAQPLPKRPVLVKRSSGSALEPSTLVGGLVWSRDDSLLCATFGNGQAVLLETRYFTKLNAFVVADSSEDDLNGVFVLPFFTRDAKLVTVDTRGFLKRWDFRPSPEKPRKLDADRTIANQGADYLAGTSRPNLWAKTRDSETQNFPFVINDGGKEIYRQENVEYFQRLTEPGATRESFLLLDKDGLLSAIDETGAPVELGVDWNLGAPGVTPKEAERQAAALNVSPEAQAEIDRLPEEFVKKYPNGDHPEEELDQLLAQIEALTPQPADDEITFEEDALNVSPDASIGFIRVAVSPNRRAFAAIGKSDGALYVLTRAEAAEGWRLVAEPQDAETPFARLAFRPDSRELAAIDEDGRVTFVPFDAAPDAPNEVVWSQKTFVSNDLGAWPSVNGGAFVYTTSGKFLLQTGLGNPRVFVWDVETRSQTSFIEPKFYERTLRDPLVISDIVPLRLNDGADAFVVAGRADGVLRFYRYNDANGRFSQVYATSPTKLSDFIESEESAQSRENHNQILRQLSGGNEFDSERNDTLFWDDSRLVGCLSVSDDQKTLYVGSLFHFQVCSYDLDEIRRNIETLPEYWRDFDVESATGLRYTSQGELKVVDRERLVPVEAK